MYNFFSALSVTLVIEVFAFSFDKEKHFLNTFLASSSVFLVPLRHFFPFHFNHHTIFIPLVMYNVDQDFKSENVFVEIEKYFLEFYLCSFYLNFEFDVHRK